MLAKILTPSSSQERGLQTSEGVAHALGNFQAIQNSTLSWVLRVLPFAVYCWQPEH